MDLAVVDIAIIAIYGVAILVVGLWTRSHKTEEDYLLAGRVLTLPIFTMMLVSSWYGGILGVGEFTYLYGLSNWITQGFSYYVFALLFAVLLAAKVRSSERFGIPDQLDSVYGKPAAVTGSLLALLVSSPAPYLLELAILLKLIFGWSFLLSLAFSVVFVASYVLVGGYRSDVRVNTVQFVFMFAGFAVLLPYCFFQYGGASFLTSHLPTLHVTWHGSLSVQYILVWFFIALWTLVDPTFHQCCLAAKDAKTARRGILSAIVFWFLFDAMTTVAGLYSRAILPGLKDPVTAFPALADAVLPMAMKGIFIVGMLATILSTLTAFAFISAQLLGRDFFLRLVGPFRHSTLATQIGLVLSLVLSAFLVYTLPSVVELWYTIGTVAIPGLLVPLLSSYTTRFRLPRSIAAITMVLSFLTSLVWLLSGSATPDGTAYPLGIEPMYPGLGVSLVLWASGLVIRYLSYVRSRRVLVTSHA